jgi:replicative DNA helicase
MNHQNRRLDVEMIVVGTMLHDPDCIGRVLQVLDADDIGNGDWRAIFDTIVEVREEGKTPTPELVGLHLGNKLPPSLILEAFQGATSIHLEEFVSQVRSDADRRRLRLTLGRLTQEANDPAANPLAVAAAVQEALSEITTRTHRAEQTRIEAPVLMGMQFPAPKWAVDGLIPEGLTILAGSPKLGKSWLMLQLALSITTGLRAFDRYDTQPGAVLYLALEDTFRRMQSRLRTLRKRWPDIETQGLTIQIVAKRIGEGLEAELRGWLRENPKARLIIIDTLARVRPPKARNADSYAEDYQIIAALKRIADEAHIAIVLVHHTRKMADVDQFATVSGTLGLTGSADGLIVLRRERGRSDAVLHITGRDVEEAEIAMSWNADNATWTAIGDAEQYRMSKEAAAIIEVFEKAGKPLKLREIYDALENQNGIRPVQSTTRYHLGRLVNDVLLRVPGNRHV